MNVRYEVLWCETGHEDYHKKYFDGYDSASIFAMSLIKQRRTFHGCGSIHRQDAVKYSDEAGPFINWETNQTWEFSDDGVVLL